MIPLVLDQVHNILFLHHGNNLILPTEKILDSLMPDLTLYRQKALSIIEDLTIDCKVFIHRGGEQPEVTFPDATTHKPTWIPAGELFSGSLPWEEDTLHLLTNIYQELVLEHFTPESHKFSVWFFGMDQALADELASLVLKGKKTGTASLYDSYAVDDEPLPKKGELSLIVDWHGIPQCIIETTQVTIVPFNEVSADHARLEGEGDLSLTFWRKAHRTAFSTEAELFEVSFSETSRVVCERFEMVKKLTQK